MNRILEIISFFNGHFLDLQPAMPPKITARSFQPRAAESLPRSWNACRCRRRRRLSYPSALHPFCSAIRVMWICCAPSIWPSFSSSLSHLTSRIQSGSSLSSRRQSSCTVSVLMDADCIAGHMPVEHAACQESGDVVESQADENASDFLDDRCPRPPAESAGRS